MRLVIHAASLADTDDISEKDRNEINRNHAQGSPRVRVLS